MSARCPNEQGATPRDDAIRLLARREYSRAELAQRLALRAHAPDVVTACLDELAESGLQSDQRFTESFLRSRVMRGQGPLKIRGELERRGIERDLIATTLSTAEQVGEVDWYALAATTLALCFNGDDIISEFVLRKVRRHGIFDLFFSLYNVHDLLSFFLWHSIQL